MSGATSSGADGTADVSTVISAGAVFFDRRTAGLWAPIFFFALIERMAGLAGRVVFGVARFRAGFLAFLVAAETLAVRAGRRSEAGRATVACFLFVPDDTRFMRNVRPD
jgi:hypothetical protein